jgi:hypothetical protein
VCRVGLALDVARGRGGGGLTRDAVVFEEWIHIQIKIEVGGMNHGCRGQSQAHKDATCDKCSGGEHYFFGVAAAEAT